MAKEGQHHKMQFQLEQIYNEKPTIDPWLDRFGTTTNADIAYKAALRVWTRVRLAEAQNWKCCWCGCETTEAPRQKNSVTIERRTTLIRAPNLYQLIDWNLLPTVQQVDLEKAHTLVAESNPWPEKF